MRYKHLLNSWSLIAKCVLSVVNIVALNPMAHAQHNTGTPQYKQTKSTTFEFKVPFANTDTLMERMQMLYPKWRFNAPSGKITKVYLRSVTATKVFNMSNVVIKLGHTADTNYNNTLLDVPFLATTEVFRQSTYTVSTPGWIEFELSTPFQYDNTKTLIIEVSGDNGFNCVYGTSGTSAAITGKINKTTGYHMALNAVYDFGFDFAGFPASVPQVADEASMHLYPNPATGMVNLYSDKSIDGQIVVTDINGKIIVQDNFKNSEHRFSVAALSNGLYFYKIFSADKLLVKMGKLTVQH